METDNTSETDSKPWLWKKGFCPNPGGRPAGKSMKAYAKEYLSKLTDEEKDEWLEGMDKETIFKMAEGNPETKSEVKIDGEKMISTTELLDFANKLNDIARSNTRESIPSDGVASITVDIETQD